MDDGISPQVVHEAEAQRQHPRVRIPGTVQIALDGGEQRYPLHDISAGGLSFVAGKGAIDKNKSYRARIAFTIAPVAFVLPVTLQVRNATRDADGGQRIGCAFQDIGMREIAVLQQLIGGTLAGELVSTGDVMTALARDSFGKPRQNKAVSAELGGKARMRALTTTAALFTLGALAFLYAVGKLYAMAFVTRASAAKIAAPSFTVAMPRDGTFFSLVPEDGKVGKGQPLGSFQAAMLDVVNTDLGALKLSPEQLSQLMGDQLKGTLSSPCDCRIQQQFAFDGQYVNRSQPLFELVPADADPYVVARFRFDSLDKLPIGQAVAFTLSGESHPRYGKVKDVRLLSAAGAAEASSSDIRGLNNAGSIADVIVSIEPNEKIDHKLINRPVDVELSGGVALSSVFASIGSKLQTASTAK